MPEISHTLGPVKGGSRVEANGKQADMIPMMSKNVTIRLEVIQVRLVVNSMRVKRVDSKK
jgi:hypothetical protein